MAYVVAGKNTVCELDNADGKEKGEEHINQLGAVGGLILPEVSKVKGPVQPALRLVLLRDRGGSRLAGCGRGSQRGDWARGDGAGVLLGSHGVNVRSVFETVTIGLRSGRFG
jgi:hypothetical protein